MFNNRCFETNQPTIRENYTSYCWRYQSSVQAYSPAAKQQHDGLAPGLGVFKLHTVSATTAVHITRSEDHSSGQCILEHKQLQPGSIACAVNQARNKKPATRADAINCVVHNTCSAALLMPWPLHRTQKRS
jgi:hypothetical protein